MAETTKDRLERLKRIVEDLGEAPSYVTEAILDVLLGVDAENTEMSERVSRLERTVENLIDSDDLMSGRVGGDD